MYRRAEQKLIIASVQNGHDNACQNKNKCTCRYGVFKILKADRRRHDYRSKEHQAVNWKHLCINKRNNRQYLKCPWRKQDHQEEHKENKFDEITSSHLLPLIP